jgi:hypothetical protein
MILGLLSFIVSFIGVILFFLNVSSLVGIFIFIGGSLGLLENLIGILSGRQNSLVTLIIIEIIAFLILQGQIPWWLIILIGAMFESAIMGVFSIPMYIMILKNSNN